MMTPPDAPARRVYLIGCGKAKRDRPSQARSLYTGDLFRKSLAYAELASRQEPDVWGEVYVLSALHHLVDLDKVVPPYNVTLKGQSSGYKRRWAERVAGELVYSGWLPWQTEFVFLAGAEYVNPLRPHLPHVSEPMAGLGIGQRLAWLKARLEGAEA